MSKFYKVMAACWAVFMIWDMATGDDWYFPAVMVMLCFIVTLLADIRDRLDI